MGFGKAFKKAVKKVKKAVKKVTKPLEKVAKGAVGAVTGLAGGAGEAQVVEVPAAQAPAAALVDVPTKDVEGLEEAETESSRKKARAGGKKSLSVARSSGGGINI